MPPCASNLQIFLLVSKVFFFELNGHRSFQQSVCGLNGRHANGLLPILGMPFQLVVFLDCHELGRGSYSVQIFQRFDIKTRMRGIFVRVVALLGSWIATSGATRRSQYFLFSPRSYVRGGVKPNRCAKRAMRQTGSLLQLSPHSCLMVCPLEENNPENSRILVQWLLAKALLTILVIESLRRSTKRRCPQ